MMHFMVFLVPALIVAVMFKLIMKREITTREFFIHLGVSLVITAVVYGGSTAFLYSSMADTEILNGVVTDKFKHTEVCSEYSSCENYHYKTVYYSSVNSKGKLERKSKQVKVFDYPTEYDWYVNSSVDETVKIKRVNARGDQVPKRWYNINKGDYFSTENVYINPLLYGSVSLFNTHENGNKFSEKELSVIPKYPEVYDYYRFNPVINRTSGDYSFIRLMTNDRLRTMGTSKQVNIIYVIFDSTEENVHFKDMLLEKWNGTKKNDVLIIIGVDKSHLITSFFSTSYANGTGNELLHSNLKINFNSQDKHLTKGWTQYILDVVDRDFKRLPASEFKYMLTDVRPSNLLIFIVVLLTFGVGIVLSRNNERN